MRIDDYILQCGVRSLCESESSDTPPTPQEVAELLAYLRKFKLNPVIVGGVAVFHHLKSAKSSDFRPTVDIDVHVTRPLPPPPSGWSDNNHEGIDSWKSPSGGNVDFIIGGQVLSGTYRTLKSVKVAPDSPQEYPVAALDDLLRMKLGTFREKDQRDLISLAHAYEFPELSGLTRNQKEDYDFFKGYAASIKARKE